MVTIPSGIMNTNGSERCKTKTKIITLYPIAKDRQSKLAVILCSWGEARKSAIGLGFTQDWMK